MQHFRLAPWLNRHEATEVCETDGNGKGQKIGTKHGCCFTTRPDGQLVRCHTDWRSDQLHDDQVHHPSDDELDGQAVVDFGDVEAKVASSSLLLSLVGRCAVAAGCSRCWRLDMVHPPCRFCVCTKLNKPSNRRFRSSRSCSWTTRGAAPMTSHSAR